MKTIATIFFIFFIGISATAQNNTTGVKVETIEMTIGTENATELNLENTTEIARHYKSKNTRVIKALSFNIKINKAKIA
jgi:hypothetical protein